MTEPTTPSNTTDTNPKKVELSVRVDAELVERMGYLTDDPSKLVETALRQWLRGEAIRDDELSRRLPRNPPVPPRGEWND